MLVSLATKMAVLQKPRLPKRRMMITLIRLIIRLIRATARARTRRVSFAPFNMDLSLSLRNWKNLKTTQTQMNTTAIFFLIEAVVGVVVHSLYDSF